MLAEGFLAPCTMTDRISNELNFYQRALGLRQQRQEVLSANIANADTPHYKARDFDFSAALHAAVQGQAGLPPVQLARTSTRHIAGGAQTPNTAELLYRKPLQASLDGNTVEMDTERMHFADNTMRYQTDLNVISQHLRTLHAAVQS